MQTVPSLVGTGTAVAAAAVGLVFAHPDDSSSTQSSSNRRILVSDQDIPPNHRLSSPPVSSSRPGTSSVAQLPTLDNDARYTALPTHFSFTSNSNSNSTPNDAPAEPSARPRRPLSSHFNFAPSILHSRRASYVKQGDQAAPSVNEDTRDSVSSSGSWMRRLSLRPLSQHGSIRSSLGFDNQSVTFSHGSAAPILSPTGSIPPPLPPNKLVKRPPSAHQNGPVMRRRSRTHLPSLRRPATSHQRSATLHQITYDGNHIEPIAEPKFSFDQYLQEAGEGPVPPRPEGDSHLQKTKSTTKWTSFFHNRRANVIARSVPDRLIDRSPSTRSATTKRILVPDSQKQDIYLIRSGMLGDSVAPVEEALVLAEDLLAVDDTPEEVHSEKEKETLETETQEEDDTPSTPEDTPTKRTHRSLTMHFNSPNWMPRAGSLRRTKRGAGSKGGGNKRHVSAPTTTSPGQAQAQDNNLAAPADESQTSPKHHPAASLDPTTNAHLRTRSRNSSSPLPPLSRLSSFNVDVSRLGSSSGGVTPSPRSIHPSGSSQGSAALAAYNRSATTDRSSTMNSSDFDARFISGDDYDTDLQSDTVFDSLRTAESDRNRAAETPLDHMFDESPPSTAGHPKAKRLSIQEMLSHSWDANERIMEEDENMPTPVRVHHEPRIRTDSDTMAPRYSLERPSNEYSLGSKDFGRLSIEDDFDEDWARDEDEMAYSNQLSPPSSMNSRGVSPNLRMALANISGNGNADATHDDPSERPRSNIFDWSEPTQEKPDLGSSFRPKTAYGKQEPDLRGGRAAIRMRPSAMHVRSQSVPVVHDPTDRGPVNPKFGTWGLSSKTVSEDWDDDFEFGGNESEDKETENAFAMVVPASIQASQPSLKQHSGHIRELSLLVNDLKRLCRHGRDLDMLGGSNAGLWEEAEGIIALASPDEDELEGMDVDSSSIMSGFDAASPDPIEKEDPFDEVHEINVSKTAVIRERPAGRRRSVFSPDDDIFGGNSPAPDELPPPRPRTPENNINMGGHDVTDIVRSVLDAMQQRSVSDAAARDDKLHFGTNSLKALVKRAGDLRDILSEVIRRADQLTSSPARTPRQHNDSPAFTRVFTPDPSPSSPPKKLPHSRSANSALGRGSVDASPSSGLQRMQMMTVS